MAQLRQKLNKTNDLLAKLRPQVSSSLLKTIYFAFFDSHLCYTTQVWSNNVMDLIKRTQNKALQIISFKDRAEPSNSLYANHKILKLQKSLHWIVACLSIYIFDQPCDNLPNPCSNYFKLLKNQHRTTTRDSNHFMLC